MVERNSQARFTIDNVTNEFVEAQPIPEGANIQMIGRHEVIKLGPSDSSDLARRAGKSVQAQRRELGLGTSKEWPSNEEMNKPTTI